MSRQEVNPASNVIRAFRAPHNASRGGVDFVSASSQCTRSSPVRCVCRSISPGSSVASPSSMTRAPAGTRKFAPTSTIRSPSIRIIAGCKLGAPVPSISRAALRIVICADGACPVVVAAGMKHSTKASSHRSSRPAHIEWFIILSPRTN